MGDYWRKTILGIPLAATSLKEIPSLIVSLVEARGKKTIFYVNAHCLNLASKDQDYRKILQRATFVYSGGLGPVLASRILG